MGQCTQSLRILLLGIVALWKEREDQRVTQSRFVLNDPVSSVPQAYFGTLASLGTLFGDFLTSSWELSHIIKISCAFLEGQTVRIITPEQLLKHRKLPRVRTMFPNRNYDVLRCSRFTRILGLSVRRFGANQGFRTAFPLFRPGFGDELYLK